MLVSDKMNTTLTQIGETPMEELLKQLIENVKGIKENVEQIDRSIHNMDKRLSRLEKMDSIEHRVSVNQIDLTDIKEIVEKIETFQREIVLPMAQEKDKVDLTFINRRMDAQLTKIAQNEEAILMINGKKEENK
jgi:GDP-D-mannose dehydratase